MNASAMDVATTIKMAIRTVPACEVPRVFKTALNTLNSSQFDKFKVAGTICSKKLPCDVSRGRMKLDSLISEHRLLISENVL